MKSAEFLVLFTSAETVLLLYFFSFLNDPSYKEIIENSSTFNSRLCAERRMRMPFIDTQTGKKQLSILLTSQYVPITTAFVIYEAT